MQFILEDPGLSMKRSRVKCARFVVVIDELVRGLNYEKDVLVRREVKVGVIKARTAKGLRR